MAVSIIYSTQYLIILNALTFLSNWEEPIFHLYSYKVSQV